MTRNKLYKEPKTKNLKETSISIGKIAAQLLQLRQYKEASRLAALAVRIQPNDDRLWSLLAESELRSNRLENASKAIARAKEIN